MYFTSGQLRKFFKEQGYIVGEKAACSMMKNHPHVIMNPNIMIPIEHAQELVEQYLLVPEGYILATEALKVYNIATSKIDSLVEDGTLGKCFRLLNGFWRVYVDSTKLDELQNDLVTYQQIHERIQTLGITIGSEYVRKAMSVHPKVIKAENNKQNLLHKDDAKTIIDGIVPPEGFMTLNDVTKYTGLGKYAIQSLIADYGIDTFIPKLGKPKVYVHLQQLQEVSDREANYYSVPKAAVILGVSPPTVYRLIEFGTLKNFKLEKVKRTKKYFLDKDEIHQLQVEYSNKQNEVQQPFNKASFIKQFSDEISGKPITIELRLNKELFSKFTIQILNDLNDRETSLQNRKWELGNAFDKAIAHLPSLIHTLSKDFLVALADDEQIPYYVKQDFMRFYKYACRIQSTSPHKVYITRNRTKSTISESNEDEIYPPAIYSQFYTHAKKVDLHIPHAIQKRTYANMWLFSTLLLTDMWRATDLFYEIPRIDIDILNIPDSAWFRTKKLNQNQVRLVIEQLRLSLNFANVGKTGAELLFLMIPELEESIATAAVICELHSRDVPSGNVVQKSFLLGTFFEGITPEKLKTSSSGRATHMKYFATDELLKRTKFSSHKLCKSTMTYVYFYVSEKGEAGDIDTRNQAEKLLSQGRSHQHGNSVIPYVVFSNNDGSMDTVSINLFRRGHFGWLYNTMISHVESSLSIQQSMERRTESIEELRDEFSLRELETWAEGILQNKKNKEFVVRRLMKMSRDELIEEVVKIYKCEKPSRDGLGQCFAFPDCRFPEKSSCIGCPEFIPQYQLLKEAHSEFLRLTENIRNNMSEALRLRDSMFLYRLYIIIGEAVNAFGSEKVNAYIPLETISNAWHEVKQYLEIPKKV
ncbi:helix-turn-helix domain-containing protein [Paenibacillus sp. FSL R10-2791]|uniref:helix-turn-helix domain-containing protein n=1 Tax=Paenibacillus sp. FSL R10-2791 TaxID=2954695 RepID=UPI0030FD1E25